MVVSANMVRGKEATRRARAVQNQKKRQRAKAQKAAVLRPPTITEVMSAIRTTNT